MHKRATALKEVEEVQKEVQEIKDGGLKVDGEPHTSCIHEMKYATSLSLKSRDARVKVVAETVEIPKSLFVEKTVVIPEIQTVQDPHTTENLSTEITVTGKTDHQTVVKNFVPNNEIDSFIDDVSTVDSKGSSHQDCEGPSHVGKQSGSMQQHQHKTSDATEKGEREKERKGEGGKEEGKPMKQSTSRSRRT